MVRIAREFRDRASSRVATLEALLESGLVVKVHRKSLCALAALVVAWTAGCAQDKTSSINEPTPPPTTGLLAIFTPKPAPELNLKQGQKLMTDIQRNPKRAEKLTPQEKRFLAKAFAAKQALKDEKDEGRR